MEVIYTGLRQAPASIVRVAVDADVAVVGLSILSGAHVPLCRAVAGLLRDENLDVLLVVGGNVPDRDVAELKALAVHGVFPPGSSFEDIVAFIEQNAPEVV
jgi:methylmalonyl-CoA mutase C-terminal domain/subunit